MRLLALLLLSTACAKTREAAPEDLDGLLHHLYRSFEDEQAVVDGLANLGPWLETTGRSEEAREGWQVAPLTTEDVWDVQGPEADLSAARGVAVAAVSVHPIAPHAAITVLEDQDYTDPSSYARYLRTVVDGDAGRFATGEGLIRTENDIDKSKVGVSIPYWLYKDFRWVELEDGRRAFLARSWISEGSCSESGDNCLHQSYSVDLWYAQDDADTVRLTCSWNEITSVVDGLLSEDQMVAVAVNGMLAIFEHTDAYLTEEDGY